MKIRKGEKEINVSPKAFRMFYEEQGYEKVVAQMDGESDEETTATEGTEKDEYSKMKVDELKKIAANKGIEGHEKLSKKDLIELIKDVE